MVQSLTGQRCKLQFTDLKFNIYILYKVILEEEDGSAS